MSHHTLLLFAALVAALSFAACGGDSGNAPQPRPRTATATESPSPGTTLPTLAPSPPTELRVAFVNLASPLPLDSDEPVLSDTFEERLAMVVEWLREFDPDVVGFNEASWTQAHGSATALLAKELKMESFYARANPWFPGQSRDQSDALAKQIGFEEGELILVRTDRYPLVRVESTDDGLNPRTSESGERRTALHVVVKGPGEMGEIDLYITHLTGGGDRLREAQAKDFVDWIAGTKGTGPTVVMAGLSDPAAVGVYGVYEAAGLTDVVTLPEGMGTCCRLTVLGQQEPLTVRTDYLMTDGWAPSSSGLFAEEPGIRPDGTPLYASDHNGLLATFDLATWGAGEPVN